MITKICNKCKIYKDVIYFNKRTKSKDGLRSQCKECEKQYIIINSESIKIKKKKYYQDNKESIYKKQRLKINKEKQTKYFKEYYEKNKKDILKYAKEYRESNKNEINKKQKEYYANNKDKYIEKRKEYYQINKNDRIQKNKEWRIKNRDKYINNRRKRKKERYYSDPIFRLKSNMLSRINISLKHNRKSLKTEILIGCSISELKIYLESKFIDGMSWHNRELWHIDHIIPCDSFDLSNPDQQKKCFHYTNLQPLWKEDNLKKSNKLNYELNEHPKGKWNDTTTK